ncbi:RHS repeat-associated core domain-containing protein [Lacrimispora indolis]|uniref:RHS repeat-associated core domain-containing protein n=1 Tax=Lacrimispora indolis TaxID=69825 RepID=UPI000424AC9F|nr:RHS repeat-associated core domain-containing protein [[Clostridium] methoxybenzovorans]
MVYLYDKQGNLSSEQGKDVIRTYGYDPLNRQNSVTTEKGAASYRYDGEGLRYETEEAGKVIRFVFDRGELATEESGSEQKRYCRGHHVVSLQSAREDSPHYFVCDEMGSTIFLLDQEQEIRKSYHYDPFGSIIETSGSIENRITYTGQMYDGISGQYYLRARFYNPKIGRFIQEDAYRGDGLNLYAYCQNNPIIYYDPSGYLGLCPAGKSNPQAEQTEGSGQTKYPVETETFLPDEFYNKNLPKHTTPGTKMLPKYDDYGNLKQIKYYDDYGREMGWVDFTNHGYPSGHTTPHWHEVEWNAQYPIGGYKIDHRMDSNPPFNFLNDAKNFER